MSPARKRKRRIGFGFVFTALLAGALGYGLVARYAGFADTPIAGLHGGETVLVERGDSLVAVLTKLRAAGVREGTTLEWQALARQLGAAGRIQVGEYALDAGTTPRTLLAHMRDGKVVSHRFTIVEGWNMRDLRAALAKAPLLEHDAAALDDGALMKALGHPGEHPEGRFLPETYAFTRGDGELGVLARAFVAMEKTLDHAWSTRASNLPLASKQQALVLASIVEKETGVAEERPAIAGVFVRRLQLGMKLQTDPSVIYGMGAAYDGNIRRADLVADTPYNTYTRAGLPPTPIAMPGRAALEAATHPAAGDSLYFVAVGDASGRHVFTHTLAQHQAAVQQYLQRYRARQQPTNSLR